MGHADVRDRAVRRARDLQPHRRTRPGDDVVGRDHPSDHRLSRQRQVRGLDRQQGRRPDRPAVQRDGLFRRRGLSFDAMSAGMPRRVLFAVAVVAALALPSGAAAAKDKTVWLCKPGLADNPCLPGFKTTTVSPTGEVGGVENVKADKKPAADCFYVYPTVSDDKTRNSDLSIDPEERSIALYQAARYSLHCR